MAKIGTFGILLVFILSAAKSQQNTEDGSSYQNLMFSLSNLDNDFQQTNNFETQILNSQDSTISNLISVLSLLRIENHETLMTGLRSFDSDSFTKTTLEETALINNVSETCINQTSTVFYAMLAREMWAIRMLDAVGKPPSGLLDFNFNWWGSFDECMAIVSNASTTNPVFKGKYCNTIFPLGQPEPPNTGGDGALQPVVGLSLGLCVPESCSNDDVVNFINSGVSLLPLGNYSNLLLANKTTCVSHEKKYDSKAIAVLVVVGLFIILMLVATAYDVICIQLPKNQMKAHSILNGPGGEYKHMDENEPLLGPGPTATIIPHEPGVVGEALLSFSVYTNTIKILSTAQPPGTLTAVHGIRFLSMSWVLLGHAFAFGSIAAGLAEQLLLSFSVYTNGKKILSVQQGSGTLTAVNGIRFLSMTWVLLGHVLVFGISVAGNVATYLPQVIKDWTFHAILNALVSVDSFFTLSGLLVSYLTLKELKRSSGKLNWGMFYFHRFWRLTPPYMLLMMVYVPLSPYFADGPHYPDKGFETNFCEDTWWTNLLYINNFVKTDHGCMAWSWYLANDMQFFVLSPLMLIPLHFFPALGVAVCMVFLAAVTITPGVLSSVKSMPPTMIGGGPMAGATDYFMDYYIKPYCRMGPYIIGILTGYILCKTECRCKINRFVNMIVWLVAFGFGCLIVYGLYDPLNGHPLSNNVSALYNAANRTMWGICVCWVVFACATGNGGFINTILSWKGIIPLSRLTYTVYLVHPIVLMVYFLSRQEPVLYTNFTVTIFFLGALVMSFMAAFVVSLAFESPMMGLEKVIFKRKKPEKEK